MNTTLNSFEKNDIELDICYNTEIMYTFIDKKTESIIQFDNKIIDTISKTFDIEECAIKNNYIVFNGKEFEKIKFFLKKISGYEYNAMCIPISYACFVIRNNYEELIINIPDLLQMSKTEAINEIDKYIPKQDLILIKNNQIGFLYRSSIEIFKEKNPNLFTLENVEKYLTIYKMTHY